MTLQLKCENYGTQINNTISSIQRSVEVLSNYTLSSLADFDRFRTDADYVNRHTERMEDITMALAQNTAGCMAVYIRYNPEFTRPDSGLFVVRNNTTGRFEKQTPTDLSKYDKNDKEHVGWFYEPVQAHQPVWMLPYNNDNINVYMVSYVVPIYRDGVNVGIVGMDIDYRYMQESVHNISAYSTGYAFLAYDDKIMAHQLYPVYTEMDSIMDNRQALQTARKLANGDVQSGEYLYQGVKKTYASKKLANGMQLFITAPTSEIFADSQKLAKYIIVIAVLSFLLIGLIANYVFSRVTLFANRDELTGLANRHSFGAYFKKYQCLDDESYVLFLLDIDNFKNINDTHGHNSGDLALRDLTTALKQKLGPDTVMGRWGGDEFIGVLKSDTAYEKLEALLHYVAQTEHAQYGYITLSIGVQPIHKGMTFLNLTKGADQALYESKKNGRNRITVNA
jgi:diguanylate cyclase (GGDEF)-like protein